MVKVSSERCNGCGACLEICPTGALYLIEGKAAVEQSLCRDCQACIAACPTEAISLIALREDVAEPMRVSVLRPKPEVIQVRTPSTLAPFRASLLPAVGGALAWGWREIVPRLAELLLDDLDRRSEKRQTAVVRQDRPGNGSPGRGRRRQRRRRGR